MPANPTTGVDYDNDRFAIYRVSDGVIINQSAKWPRLDGGPNEGGDPNLYYYKRTSAPPLDVDHRFTVLNEWTPVDAVPTPPATHPRGLYQQTLTAEKLPVDDLKRQVETYFQELVQRWFPSASDPAVLVEAAGAIIRKGQNAALTPEQEATLTAVVGIEDAIRANRERQNELFAAIDANEDYDITEGWVEPTA
jgi:hypothetical protein